jgi:hypothetical protein
MRPWLYAAALLFSGAASAVVLWNPYATLIVGTCDACILLGLEWKRALPILLSGWLLYLPLGAAISRALPPALGYLGAGLFTIVMAESLAFDYEASLLLGSPKGVDAETRALATELGKTHTRKVAVYVGLSLCIMAAAWVVSGTTSYASELAAVAVLLMLTIVVYASR